MKVALVDAPSVTHADGCWMDPRPHRHIIHLIEQPARPEPDPRLGIPRPTVRRAAHK